MFLFHFFAEKCKQDKLVKMKAMFADLEFCKATSSYSFLNNTNMYLIVKHRFLITAFMRLGILQVSWRFLL